MFKRILIVGGLSLTGVLGLSATSGAQTTTTTPDSRCYPVLTPSCPPSITINDTTATPGQSLTVTASNLDPNTSASAVANSTPVNLGSKTTSATGTVSFTFTVPADFENGPHTVVITGVKNGATTTLTANFTVSGAQVPTSSTTATTAGGGATTTTAAVGATTATTARTGTGTIPRTGDDSSLPMTQVGIALLALGGGAVYVAKKRRDAAA